MRRPGAIYVVGIGPGDLSQMTPQAMAAIETSDSVVGYKSYIESISGLVEGKSVYAFAMRQERARCRKAVELAATGRVVSVVSSGDPGIYGMAGLLLEEADLEIANGRVEVEIVPGLSALNVAAALLGAPLTNDFVVISLSDLLTPWSTIEKRLRAVAAADMVTVLYNPASRKRRSQIAVARDIFVEQHGDDLPVGLVRKTPGGQIAALTRIGALLESQIDMLTTVVIGNSTTIVTNGNMITPRGYRQNRGQPQ